MVAWSGFKVDGSRPDGVTPYTWSTANGVAGKQIAPGAVNPVGSNPIPNSVKGELVALISTPGSRVEVLPIQVNVGIALRFPLGANGTAHWDNLGGAPPYGVQLGFDYWEKILLDPNTVDLGNVVSDQVFNVTLRNTFRRSTQTISSIVDNAGAGITLTGPTPPATIASLQDKLYQVNVSTSGPPQIEGTYDFVTTYGTLVLSLSGSRIIVFPYPPQRGIEESLEWLTDILRAADGSEQRLSLRDQPRQKVVFDVRLESLDEINSVRNLLWDWTTRVFGVPLWWDEQSLRADITATDTTIFLRDFGYRYADFRVGGLAMIYQEFDDGTFQQEVLEVASIQQDPHSPESLSSSITFATQIQNNYDGDVATVIPVVAAIMISDAKQVTSRDGNFVKYSLNFESLDYDFTYRDLVSGEWPELDDFDGNQLIIIDDKNQIDRELSETISQERQRIDFKTGPVTQLTQQSKARRAAPFDWKSEDDAFSWQLRALLGYLRGRWQRVWIPTWRKDFTIDGNIGSAASTIDVVNHGFAKYVGTAQQWAGLRIEKTDGSIGYHRITNVAELSDTQERITIDPVTSFAATIAEVERIDLMVISRQSDDKVRILHNWNDAESDVVDETISTGFIGDL
jgi:hypothetical protein